LVESKYHHQFCRWNLQFSILALTYICNMLYPDVTIGYHNMDLSLTVSKPHSGPFLQAHWLWANMITRSHVGHRFQKAERYISNHP
jgi:hypothetical protein